MKFSTIAFSGLAAAALAFTTSASAQHSPEGGDKAKSASTNTTTSSTGSAGGAMSAADRQFVEEAAKGGMMEVEMGKVAAKNATDAGVKNFGNTMVSDHSKANAELKAIASKKGIKLPAKPAAGAWKSDKDYMQMMLHDHEKDLAAFQKESKNGSDPDLKRFATDKAGIIRGHLSMAKQINGKLK